MVFYNRVENFMKHIQKEEDGNYLIVTHGGVIRMIYSYILQNNMDFTGILLQEMEI